jgi:ribonucleoside-triphosphate reductase (thioredoxin)
MYCHHRGINGLVFLKTLSRFNMKDYSHYIHTSRYARWLHEENRRESWEETVKRYIDFFERNCITGSLGMGNQIWADIQLAVTNMDVMPSMRAMMTAGKALERDNVAGYNCAYLAVDSPRAFDETMYILMCGTGVGFSVERQFVNELPTVPEVLHDSETPILIRDSKIGWASAYKEFISLLYAGSIPKWDLSKVRPAGAKLKTMGGRASGPQPLDDLFRFTIEVFRKAVGRKLNSLECHDIMCKIADIVVVGGVRRSALISLSNLTDERMRIAKSGQWWEENPQRALSNNSVCYTEKPDLSIFMKEWISLHESKSGERGIFNRVAATKKAGESGRRDTSFSFGCNPCSEIILRPKQFCNLTEVVVRREDNLTTLREKVRIATILGTLQSTLTDFRYLSSVWKKNCEEERLLGVSLTGIMDHPVLSGSDKVFDIEMFEGDTVGTMYSLPEVLHDLKEVAIETNKEWAEMLGINPSTAITCVKPSGTVSQLVDSASGIHPRYAAYYQRTVRSDNKDPLTMFLKEQGVPWEADVTKPDNTTVFSFPMKSPEGSVTRKEMGAIEQLELWLIYQDHWCEHKPSMTVYYKDNEFLEVGAWVYRNFDKVSGVSFLPYSDHIYKQAPYQEITEEQYNEAMKTFPIITWEKFDKYESEDSTTIMKEFACSGDKCELT